MTLSKDECAKALELVSTIVAAVRRSQVDTKTVYDSVQCRLPIMNATRWSSQVTMTDAFGDALEKDPDLQRKFNACTAHGSVHANQQKLLKNLTFLMLPAKMATDALQKDTETGGIVIPIYLDLMNRTGSSSLNPNFASLATSGCYRVAKAFHKSLETRMGFVLKDLLYQLCKFQAS